MRFIDEHTAAAYLREVGLLSAHERAEIEPLSGGVSNQVLYVACLDRDHDDFVLKQARPQLRTPDPWFCGVERIWREVEVLRICQRVLEQPPSSGSCQLSAQTPRVLFEDREQYVFAMSAAPRDHRVWKQELLAGTARPEIAAAMRRPAGTLSCDDLERPTRGPGSRRSDDFRSAPLGSLLPLPGARPCRHAAGPRATDRVAPEPPESVGPCRLQPQEPAGFPGGLMMVDFETGHFGDPAFDLGFFLSHLMLKAVQAAPGHEPYLDLTTQFWAAYRDRARPSRAGP